MDITALSQLLVPILIASIGLLGPIIKTFVDRKKPDAEALQIYNDIEVSSAKAAQATIVELRTEIKRLEKLLKKHGISPHESISEPLEKG